MTAWNVDTEWSGMAAWDGLDMAAPAAHPVGPLQNRKHLRLSNHLLRLVFRRRNGAPVPPAVLFYRTQ